MTADLFNLIYFYKTDSSCRAETSYIKLQWVLSTGAPKKNNIFFSHFIERTQLCHFFQQL